MLSRLQDAGLPEKVTRARVRFTLTLVAAGAALLSACRENPAATAAAPPLIELKAAVAPFDSVTVYAPIEGRVSQVDAAEGAQVTAGQQLVMLTNPAVARDLVYARSAVTTAEQRHRGSVAPRATTAQPHHDRERIAIDLVQHRRQRLARLRRLLANGDVAKQEVENAEAELAVAERDLAAIQESLAPAASPSAASPVMMQVEEDRARADLALAEHRQSLLNIAAPAAGTLANLRVAVGRDVYARDPIAEIIDSRSARVRASIAPELLNYVRVGQLVDVKLMTIPSRRFREPIARVIQPGADSGAAIIVNIPNPDRMLQPGTPAMLTIQ